LRNEPVLTSFSQNWKKADRSSLHPPKRAIRILNKKLEEVGLLSSITTVDLNLSVSSREPAEIFENRKND
jgi:hypothetical protein